MQRTDTLDKALRLGKIEGKRRGTAEDEMVWIVLLNGQEFGETLGDSEGQGTLARCSS